MKLKKKIKLLIACDGGAASGKTTASKMISKKYNLKLLSSGLLYRYISYKLLSKKNLLNKSKYIKKISKNITLKKIKSNKLFSQSIPMGGGGYFRLLPFWVYHFAFKTVFRDKDFVFYFHPWEIDENQPKIHQISYLNRFRQYAGLKSNMSRLRKFINHYSNNCVTMTQYNNEYKKFRSIQYLKD